MEINQHYPYDKTEIISKISNRESFAIRNLSDRMTEVTAEVERLIEDQGLTCRVYAHNRAAVVAASTFVPFLGWANLAAIAVHNISTWNPDYEIGKDLIDKVLHVKFKK